MKIFQELTDKIVVITGGSSGLGEQIAYEAAAKGAIVVVCARRIQLIGKVKQRCMEISGKEAYAFQLNVAEPDDIEEVSQKILTEVGVPDVLVNCAGFGSFEDFLSVDMAAAYRMFEVNVLGMMVLTQKMAIEMAEKGAGHIINVASMAGKMATAKSTLYSATKFAVLGFSNALRLELKPLNIGVTTVNPGPIRTEFFDQADPSGDYLSSVDWVVLDPEKLARQIVKKMGTTTREINKPELLEVAARFYTLFPHIGDFLAGSLFNKK
ncbi:SDR family NAD(P)-dependent oxidoreductase [Enterococcus canis]|uniref:SDR family NAD(P)-dependent oxidoreductase n=1 Tax=Enterococcus canis TaxID=214095 RepID=UPI0008334868|nr:SDR family oxidoreductase [Enterococcus canis]